MALRRLTSLSIALLAALAGLALAVFSARAQAPDPAQIEQGARLYAENCAVCHGADGQGRVGAVLAKDWPSIRPDLRVRATIANGIDGTVMPAWLQAGGGPLSDADIDALTAYILTWESGGTRLIVPPPTSAPRPLLTAIPEVQGDPNNGAALFDQNCAVCHGADGRGRVGAQLAKNWSSIRPDLGIKATIERGVEGAVMPAWSQTNGGPLTDTEINDLTAFILTLPQAATSPDQPDPTGIVGSTAAWMRDWGGVLLTILLLVVIFSAALLVQRRR
jgi:mono/diheme cytochrome c family protein